MTRQRNVWMPLARPGLAHRSIGAFTGLAILTGGFPSAALAVASEPKAPAGLEPAPAEPALLQEDVYLLGPGDGLQLRFLAAKDLTDLSGQVEILNDGTASLPLLGSVRLTGLSLSQATLWLEALYRKQVLRPELQLTVIRPRPLRVALVGEVERPGLYTLTTSETSATEAGVTISGLPTLVDGIQKAGGITLNADLRRVVLQRRLPGDTVSFKRTRVNLLALLREGDQLQNPLLFDGDTIRIEKATEESGEVMELSSTTLAPTQIKVNVVGEVKAPGRIDLPANTPLMQAIQAAGGTANWRASRSKLELVRINRNGTATRRTYTLDLSQGASNTKNPPLRDGDTVIVNRSRYAITSDAIGAVSGPLTGLVNIFTLFRLLDNTSN